MSEDVSVSSKPENTVSSSDESFRINEESDESVSQTSDLKQDKRSISQAKSKQTSKLGGKSIV